VKLFQGCFSENCKTWRRSPKIIGIVIQLTDLLHVLGIAICPQIFVPFIGRIRRIPLPPAAGTNQSDVLFDPSTNAPFTSSSSYFVSTDDDPTVTSSMTTELPAIDRSRAQPIQIGYAVIAIINAATAAVCVVAYVISVVQLRRRRLEYCRRLSSRRRSVTLNEEDLQRIMKSAASAKANNDETGNGSAADTETASAAAAAIRRSRSLEKLQMMCTHPLVRDADIPMTIDGRRPKRLQGGSSQSSPPSSSNSLSGGADQPPAISLRSLPVVFLLVIIVVFYVVLGAREAMLTGMLFTYLVTNLHWPMPNGTLLLTVYQVTRVVVHVATVALAGCVSAAAITVVNVVILIASAVVMTATVGLNPIFFAAGVVLGAVAASNVMPTALSLARRTIAMDGRVTGVMIAAIALGQSIMSPIVGHLMDAESGDASATPYAFPVLLVLLSVVSGLLVAVWLATSRWLTRKREAENSSSAADEKTPLLKV
jgi:hypothetical protein